jgi:hypothetical protein
MLARAWSGPEATAIWVELVASRKQDIKKNSDPSQPQGFLARTVSEMELPRSQLAAWDASARAWLRSADESKTFQQTQLRLILKDSGLSINSSRNTYSSVVEAWTLAMSSLQKLIQGIPQNISKASILLGLLSWHIYPDLNIVDPMTHVNFSDPLVNHGGVVTLGLNREGASDTGVRWSLALSHLRFYGEPVALERSIGSDDGRITIPELHIITLGCVISTWFESSSIEIAPIADCFEALEECLWPKVLDPCPDDDYRSAISWILHLSTAARTIISSDGMKLRHYTSLLEFGRRRGRGFLDSRLSNCVPMFGLADPELFHMFYDWLKEDTIDPYIELMRGIAKHCNLRGDDCLIRYVPSERDSGRNTGSQKTPEYTTAISHPVATTKRMLDGTPISGLKHTYWIYFDSTVDPYKDQSALWRGALSASDLETLHSWQTFRGCSCVSCCDSDGNGGKGCPCQQLQISCTSLCTCTRNYTTLSLDKSCHNGRARRSEILESGAYCHWLSSHNSNLIESTNHRRIWWSSPPVFLARRYRDLASEDDDIDLLTTFNDQLPTAPESLIDQEYCISRGGRTELVHFAGDERVGLFVSNRAPRITPSVMINLLTEQLRSGKINPDKLAQHIAHLPADDMCGHSSSPEHQVFFDSLKAVRKLSDLYREWPEATVSIEITRRSIGLALWNFPELGRYEADTSTQSLAVKHRAEKFACIAMMETGDHDLHYSDLESVVALASGNSIYVAESLLQDPSIHDRSRDPEFVGIRRILGNLDRPGVVMLVPPKSSLIREPDLKSWKLVQQADFDGILSDSFKQTSLHLSFTDFEVPIAIKSGAVDAEVVLLEALVSVHDGRQWVADFHDRAIRRETFLEPFIVTGCSTTCEGPPNKELGQALFQDLGRKLKSINNWDELLCSQDNLLRDEIGVVQTHNNWTSRLAASVICNRKRIPSTVLPSQPTCAECNKKIVDSISWKASRGPSVIIV